jgi:hypothetical protein
MIPIGRLIPWSWNANNRCIEPNVRFTFGIGQSTLIPQSKSRVIARGFKAVLRFLLAPTHWFSTLGDSQYFSSIGCILSRQIPVF